MDKVLPTGVEKNVFLQTVWKFEHLLNFADCLKCYHNRNVAPTLKTMHKMVDFNHNNGIDSLRVGCTVRMVDTVCWHKSTELKFCPFTETDKHLLDKIQRYHW